MNENPGAKHALAERQQDLALRQYDCILRYLASDNTVYWSRSQLLLVANAALVGFIFKEIPSPRSPGETWTQLIVLTVSCLVGIGLCSVWFLAIKAGLRWMDRWIAILQRLEGRAFGEISVHRERFSGVRSRTIANLTAALFMAVWVFATVYLFACLMLKTCHS